MKPKFVYIIYDTINKEIWETYFTEEECVTAYNEKYNGFVNIDWMGYNLSFWLKENYKI